MLFTKKNPIFLTNEGINQNLFGVKQHGLDPGLTMMLMDKVEREGFLNGVGSSCVVLYWD